jgi:hypothetical protein
MQYSTFTLNLKMEKSVVVAEIMLEQRTICKSRPLMFQATAYFIFIEKIASVMVASL